MASRTFCQKIDGGMRKKLPGLKEGNSKILLIFKVYDMQVIILIQYTVFLSILFNPARILLLNTVLFSNAKDGKTHAGIRIPPAQSSKLALLPVRGGFTLLNPLEEGREAAFNRVNFETFEQVYEERFERQYGFYRPYVGQVMLRYLDCGILHNGFARVRCGRCGHEYLLEFSCKRRHFCPSLAPKRMNKILSNRTRELFV